MQRHLHYAATPFGDIAYTDTAAGTKTATRTDTAAEPVALFLHGVFLNGYLWRHVIERVAPVRRCIAIDLLAHGATRTPPHQDVSFTAQADMLEAFCATLGLDEIDLVANDSGGGIAQIFAVRQPQRLRSLTLTNCDVHDNWPPPALEPTRTLIAQGGLPALGDQLLGDVAVARAAFSVGYENPDAVSMDTLKTYLEPLFATPQSIANLERWFTTAHDCSQTVQIEPLLRELDVPTLVMWGTADIFFPVQWAHWLRDTIPGCRKVIELEGAKLFFPEERPEAVADALLEHWRTNAQPAAVSAGG